MFRGQTDFGGWDNYIDSLRESLNIFVGRVPADKLGSGAIMSIPAFINDYGNTGYIPALMNLRSGGDFDIDQLASYFKILEEDGTKLSVDSINVRITEYTTDVNGLQTMPAQLPANVLYTYAFELSADEAQAKIAGKDLLFNHPVPIYAQLSVSKPRLSAARSSCGKTTRC